MKCVLGVVVVAEDTAAHAPHHRTMPLHEGRKTRLVPAADVLLQQLPIGHLRPIPQKHLPANVLDDLADRAGRHVFSFVGATIALYLNTICRRRFDTQSFALTTGWPASVPRFGQGAMQIYPGDNEAVPGVQRVEATRPSRFSPGTRMAQVEEQENARKPDSNRWAFYVYHELDGGFFYNGKIKAVATSQIEASVVPSARRSNLPKPSRAERASRNSWNKGWQTRSFRVNLFNRPFQIELNVSGTVSAKTSRALAKPDRPLQDGPFVCKRREYFFRACSARSVQVEAFVRPRTRDGLGMGCGVLIGRPLIRDGLRPILD